ncbi:hypothetical protein FB451DRAFT_1193015 [Mycena latifolia]|nr:hypothetical protein FB451DRAFT_1193015 [Mycena latifolia]
MPADPSFQIRYSFSTPSKSSFNKWDLLKLSATCTESSLSGVHAARQRLINFAGHLYLPLPFAFLEPLVPFSHLSLRSPCSQSWAPTVLKSTALTAAHANEPLVQQQRRNGLHLCPSASSYLCLRPTPIPGGASSIHSPAITDRCTCAAAENVSRRYLLGHPHAYGDQTGNRSSYPVLVVLDQGHNFALLAKTRFTLCHDAGYTLRVNTATKTSKSQFKPMEPPVMPSEMGPTLFSCPTKLACFKPSALDALGMIPGGRYKATPYVPGPRRPTPPSADSATPPPDSEMSTGTQRA